MGNGHVDGKKRKGGALLFAFLRKEKGRKGREKGKTVSSRS